MKEEDLAWATGLAKEEEWVPGGRVRHQNGIDRDMTLAIMHSKKKVSSLHYIELTMVGLGDGGSVVGAGEGGGVGACK